MDFQEQSQFSESSSNDFAINSNPNKDCNKRLIALTNTHALIQEKSALEADETGYMNRSLVLATMPHSKQVSNEFHRKNGNYSMSMLAPSHIGLPYGSKPRLVLMYLITEAKLKKCRDIVLGESLSRFMAELGLQPTGGRWGSIAGLKDQMTRLFSTSIHCRWEDQDSSKIANMAVVSNAQLWWDHKRPEQGNLWESTVRLGEEFYNDAIECSIPFDKRAVRALKQSPLSLDIYLALTHRMSYQKNSSLNRPIPWRSLQKQYGSGYPETAEGVKNFKKKFTKHLRNVLVLYPSARVEICPKGLIIRASPTHVPKRLKAKS